MSLYTIQSGFNATDSLTHIYLSTGTALNNNTEYVKNFIKTSFTKTEGRNNVYINSAGDLYNTRLINYNDCLVVSIAIENGVVVQDLKSTSGSQGPGIDASFVTQLIDKKINELSININEKDLYSTITEYNTIQYDIAKGVYYTTSTKHPEGSMISFIIITSEEDIEVLRNINIIDKRIEFMSDFDARNLQARMIYIYKI